MLSSGGLVIESTIGRNALRLPDYEIAVKAATKQFIWTSNIMPDSLALEKPGTIDARRPACCYRPTHSFTSPCFPVKSSNQRNQRSVSRPNTCKRSEPRDGNTLDEGNDRVCLHAVVRHGPWEGL